MRVEGFAAFEKLAASPTAPAPAAVRLDVLEDEFETGVVVFDARVCLLGQWGWVNGVQSMGQ